MDTLGSSMHGVLLALAAFSALALAAGVALGHSRPITKWSFVLGMVGLAVESEVRVRTGQSLDPNALSQLQSVQSATVENETASLHVLNPAQAISALVRYLDSQNNELMDVSILRPTLEDLFIKLVGEKLTGEED